jgi:hypothetical protein
MIPLNVFTPILVFALLAGLIDLRTGFGEAQTKPKVPSQPNPQKVTPSSSGNEHATGNSTASSNANTNKKSRKQAAAKTSKRKKATPRGQREMEPSRVTEIQNALAAAGYYKNEPSGKWDESTSGAMSAYQESNGFKVTGKPDALSLKKLGL